MKFWIKFTQFLFFLNNSLYFFIKIFHNFKALATLSALVETLLKEDSIKINDL